MIQIEYYYRIHVGCMIDGTHQTRHNNIVRILQNMIEWFMMTYVKYFMFDVAA